MTGETSATLDVFLADRLAGALTLTPGERIEFALREEYISSVPRPVLGQTFEDDPYRRHHSRLRLPPFFSNLLPEGPLRELIAKRERVSSQREFLLIARLGQDLPGAVRVEPPRELDFAPEHAAELVVPPAQLPLHFSLSGVQLKFSVIRSGKALTLPVSGLGGDWIVKLPDNRYPLVPQNEFSTMSWARAAGLNVPEFELVPISEIGGLPDEASTWQESQAYVVKRFDRTPGGRVHMEDFTQVFGLYSDDKYQSNYESIARVLSAVAGQDALEEFIRRLVFLIASGNSDAHQKNWSLLYQDGIHPSLSPAYDLLSTIHYLPSDGLALNFARSKRFEDISNSSFERLARKLGVDEAWVLETARRASVRTLDSWMTVRGSLPIPDEFKAAVESHWTRVPFLTSRG